jgi:serine/threonine protein kinase
VKILNGRMAVDPSHRSRLQREARTVASLNHPNVVTVHTFEEADSPRGPVHFLTMEFIDGRTWRNVLPSGGLDPRRLLELALPLADAVACAHRKSIVHRDLTDIQVMITLALSNSLRSDILRHSDIGSRNLTRPFPTPKWPGSFSLRCKTTAQSTGGQYAEHERYIERESDQVEWRRCHGVIW